MKPDIVIQRAAHSHRRFRKKYPAADFASAGRSSDISDAYSDAGILADAYIALIDEQETLKQPYDWEWLKARPEFEEGQSPKFLICIFDEDPRWKIVASRCVDGAFLWSIDFGDDYVYIPTPATKGDVITLLEVFT